MGIDPVNHPWGMNLVVLLKFGLPAIANTQTQVRLTDRAVLALLEIGTAEVFNMMNCTNKMGNLLTLPQDS